MRALSLLLVTSCVAAPPASREPPPRPDLDAVRSPTPRPRFVLRGEAPGALVVRVTVDRACAGPTLLELSASDFEAGVSVALVLGPNVFTAQSISSDGKRSECSAPLEVLRFFPPAPEPLTNIVVWPGFEAAARTFVVTGVAPPDTVVQLHRGGSCGFPVEETATAEHMATEGMVVTFVQDGLYSLAFDVLDELNQASRCESITVWSKVLPPWASFDYGSPQPTPESTAWFVVTGDFRVLQAWSGPDCDGVPVGACSQLNGRCLLLVQQPGPTWGGPLSASLRDAIGNTSCVTGPSYFFDVNAPTAPELFVAFDQLRVRVHAGRDRVDLFASPDCSGPPIGTHAPTSVLGLPLRYVGQLDGGVFSARSYVSQTTPDPCSLPLYAP